MNLLLGSLDTQTHTRSQIREPRKTVANAHWAFKSIDCRITINGKLISLILNWQLDEEVNVSIRRTIEKRSEWVLRKLLHFSSLNGRFLCSNTASKIRTLNPIRAECHRWKTERFTKLFKYFVYCWCCCRRCYHCCLFIFTCLYGREFFCCLWCQTFRSIPFLRQWNEALTKFVHRTPPTTPLRKLFCRCSRSIKVMQRLEKGKWIISFADAIKSISKICNIENQCGDEKQPSNKKKKYIAVGSNSAS